MRGTGLIMVGQCCASHAELRGLSPQDFQTYLNYLLGDHVWNLVAKDSNGDSVAHPPWAQVLAYEQAIRKKAWQLVQRDKLAFPDALKKGYTDTLVKDRHFTTPLTLYTLVRKREHGNDGFISSKRGKGGGNGGGHGQGGHGGGPKGKGKKAGKSKGKEGHTVTPDGKPICFRYNDNTKKCNGKKCRFIHVCSLCLGKHPAYQCRGPAKGADTQGEGLQN